GDDSRVVGRVRDDPPVSLGEPLHDGDRFVVVAPLLDDRGAECAHGGVLVGIVPRRHAHRRRDAEQTRAVGDALPMIAGRRRDHAAPALPSGERRHERKPIPNLERSRRLMILVLDEELDPATRGLGEPRVLPQRRRREIGRDALARGLHIAERDRRSGRSVGERSGHRLIEGESLRRNPALEGSPRAMPRATHATRTTDLGRPRSAPYLLGTPSRSFAQSATLGVPTEFGAIALDAWNNWNTNHTNEREFTRR